MAAKFNDVQKIKDMFESQGGNAEIPLLRGNRTFSAEVVNGGINVSNLGNQPYLSWEVFEEAVKLLKEQGGRVVRGNAMKNKLGEPSLPLNSLEGHIANKVYGKQIGDSVFRRITPVVCILVWAGICSTKPREIILIK